MRAGLALSGLLLPRLAVCGALPAAQVSPHLLENRSAEDLMLWSVSLLAILAALVFVQWGFRKFNGGDAPVKDPLRVIGRLSLGMWKKVVLLQAGNKQLVLGVTPGQIQTLQVLEGDECQLEAENAAAQKRKEAMPALTEANPLPANGGQAAAEQSSPGHRQALDREEPLRLSPEQSYEKHLEYVQRLVDQNPKLAAQTLKAWIRDE
jgi:flagellar protein FliO/FliZ